MNGRNTCLLYTSLPSGEPDTGGHRQEVGPAAPVDCSGLQRGADHAVQPRRSGVGGVAEHHLDVYKRQEHRQVTAVLGYNRAEDIFLAEELHCLLYTSPWVCISILGLIQTMEPRSVTICSPSSS